MVGLLTMLRMHGIDVDTSYWGERIAKDAERLERRKLNYGALALDLVPLGCERLEHGTLRREKKGRELWDTRQSVGHGEDRHGYDMYARWMELLRMDGSLLEDGGTAARERDLVLAAVRNYGAALQWADKPLRDDRELVMIAVKQNGLALKFASDRLKEDRKLVLTAGRENIHALKYASPTLKEDHDFMCVAGVLTRVLCLAGTHLPSLHRYRGIREHERKLRWLDNNRQHVLIKRLGYNRRPRSAAR